MINTEFKVFVVLRVPFVILIQPVSFKVIGHDVKLPLNTFDEREYYKLNNIPLKLTVPQLNMMSTIKSFEIIGSVLVQQHSNWN